MLTPPPTHSPSQRNTALLNSIYNAKTTFKVVTPSTSVSSSTHSNLASAMSRHCVEIERLFPTYTASLSYESAEQVQRLEEERRNTDLRREKAKDAFGREKALRDAVEKKRQDLAVAQLAEHNEEMERNARRNELVATSKKVDEILINEAAKSGEEARAKILKKSAMEREEIIKNCLSK